MKDLAVRTLSAVVYVAVMVLGTVVFPQLFPALASAVMLMCMYEFYNISLGRGVLDQEKWLAMLSAFTAMMILIMHYTMDIPVQFVSIALLPMLWILVRQIFALENPSSQNLDKLTLIFTGLCYIGVPIAMVPMIYYPVSSARGILLLSFFIMIWCGDAGAYFLGTAFGQKPNSRKLAPAISSKKSWWGFAGEVIFSCIAALVLHYIGWLAISISHCMFLGALLATGSVLGDLVESIWKRHFGVKDSGNVMPGHGGMLDRFDSSLIAIPVAGIYLSCFGLL